MRSASTGATAGMVNFSRIDISLYIHLNPLRAKLVDNLKALDTYAYGGHSVMMGKGKQRGQNADYILKFCGNKRLSARRGYREFVAKDFDEGRKPELVGGGIIRSAGGCSAVKALRKRFERIKGDERVLGDSQFVGSVLEGAQEKLDKNTTSKPKATISIGWWIVWQGS